MNANLVLVRGGKQRYNIKVSYDRRRVFDG